MNLFLRLAAVLSLVIASDAAAQGLTDVRIAYFSPQRAFAQSTDGKAAQAKLTALQAERVKEIESRNVTLAAERQALERDAPLLNDAARAQRQQAVDRFEVDLQRFIQDAQNELMGVQRDLETAFLAKLRPALDQVAKDKSLLLVLNEDTGLIAWADLSLDITPEVVKRLPQ
jgi:outer membrane protein